MDSSVFTDNGKKDILTLGEGPIQGIDDATLTAEAKYSVILHSQIENYV